MAAIINILVVVDAESIHNQYRLNKNSNFSSYIRMYTDKKHMKEGQGTSELTVLAKKGDSIRSHVITISEDSQYCANLEKFFLSNDDPSYKTIAGEYFTSPTIVSSDRYVPVLLTKDPVKMGTQHAPSYYWSTDIIKSPEPGQSYTVAYKFDIGIYFNDELKEYISWDPYVTVENS